MRPLIASLILFAACASPGQKRLAETPTAHTKMNTGEAPAASMGDRDREHEVNAMDDMVAAQKAHKEATASGANAAPEAQPRPPGPPGAVQPNPEPAQPK